MGFTRRRVVPVVAASATVALHLLLLTPTLWGDGERVVPPRLPDAFGAGANAGSAGGSFTERLILIDVPTEISSTEQVLEAQLLAELESPPSILHITGLDSLPLRPLVTSPEGEAEEASEADLIARTKLVGLYEGQIRARIERAWRRPREALEEGGFACRVKIRQDPRGRVTEVELERCNGSARWQQSLAMAVSAASPLPAPPNPEVFVDAFSMSFRSLAYTADGPDEGFEPVMPQLAVASTPAPRAAFSLSSAPQAQGSSMPASEGVLDLRIVGDQATWTATEPR